MRFVVFGAGAVGGVVGGRLAEGGHEVLLIARGAHYDTVRDRGLRIQSPEREITLQLPVVDHPRRVAWQAGDVVLLTTKTHASAAALRELVEAAPFTTPIVSMQNGVENERLALRSFANVYGVCVACPTSYLDPGVVQAWSEPTTGILDIGRYPSGVDATAAAIAGALRDSTFESELRADIMRWKYGKLLMNLGNALEALAGPDARSGTVAERTRREGEACLDAARIAHVSQDEDRVRRGNFLRLGRIDGQSRGGGSSWQSLKRKANGIETDFLNGEIVLLGRLHGVPTPINERLQRLANRLAAEGAAPGTMTPSALATLLLE